MSHVTKVKVVGLLGNKTPVEWIPSRNINVIYGDNGTGKSSLLKIIQSAFTGDTTAILGLKFDRAEVSIYSASHETEFKYIISKNDAKEVIESVDSVKEEVVSPSPEGLRWGSVPAHPNLKKGGTVRWIHEYLPTNRLHVGSERVSTSYGGHPSQLDERKLDELFAILIRDNFQKYAFSIVKKVREAQQEGISKLVKAALMSDSQDVCSSTYMPDYAYNLLDSFLGRSTGLASNKIDRSTFDGKYKIDIGFTKAIADVVQIEEKVRDAMKYFDDFKNLLTELYSGNKVIEVGENGIVVKTKTGDVLSLVSLSSGEKHILRIFIAILSVGESTLIIDEPELSLHVKWQTRLVDDLRKINPSAQVIMATHSPEIVAAVSADEKYGIILS